MNYWLFIQKDAIEVFNKRMDSKTWPIYQQTAHRKKLEVGDCIVFYKAGPNGQKFVGSARIASQKLAGQDKFVTNLEIDDVNVWSECPSIMDFVTKLSFIKNELKWGVYLQSGVKRLTERDYSLLTKKAERMNQKPKEIKA